MIEAKGATRRDGENAAIDSLSFTIQPGALRLCGRDA
jgi:hypothetical protein